MTSARRNASSASVLAVRTLVHELADHAMAAAEMRPRRREIRDRARGTAVELARFAEPVVGCARVRSRGDRARRRARRAAHRAAGDVVVPPAAAPALRHLPRDVVLQPEEIAERRLHRMRGEQRAARRLDELRRRPAGRSPERSSVPMTTRSTSASAARALKSGVSPAKRAAVALDRTISDPRPDKGRRDRVGQTERQKVGFGIGAQHAERQHDQPRQRVGQRRRVIARAPRIARSSAAMSSAEAGRSAGASPARAG